MSKYPSVCNSLIEESENLLPSATEGLTSSELVLLSESLAPSAEEGLASSELVLLSESLAASAEEKLISFIGKNKVVTSSEVAKYFKISWNTAESYLKELLIEGKLKRIKKDGVNLWLKK